MPRMRDAPEPADGPLLVEQDLDVLAVRGRPVNGG